MKTLMSKRVNGARQSNIGRIPTLEIGVDEEKTSVEAVETILVAIFSGDSKVVQEQEFLLDDRTFQLTGLTDAEGELIESDPVVKSRLPRIPVGR